MSSGPNWSPEPGLASDIPETYPAKTQVEDLCQRMLSDLGVGWRIRIVTRNDARVRRNGKWVMDTSLDLADGRHLHRTWHVYPEPASIERRLRQAVDEIRREATARFGMLPAGTLVPAIALDLAAFARANGATIEPDGWIWFPNRASWPALVEYARQLGVQLVADVR